MMKVHPAVGIISLILGLFFVTLVFLYISIPPPLEPGPITPYIAMARYEDSPDYTLKIIRMSEPVEIHEVEMVIISRESESVVSYNLQEIIIEDPDNNVFNISYHDNKKDNKLSLDDSLILKIDYDGPNLDGNNDGNYTNEGPYTEGDVIRFMHKEIGSIMCVHTISF
jgi:hypothetical protein